MCHMWLNSISIMVHNTSIAASGAGAPIALERHNMFLCSGQVDHMEFCQWPTEHACNTHDCCDTCLPCCCVAAARRHPQAAPLMCGHNCRRHLTGQPGWELTAKLAMQNRSACSSRCAVKSSVARGEWRTYVHHRLVFSDCILGGYDMCISTTTRLP